GGRSVGLTPLLLSVRVCRCLDSARAFGLDVSRLRRRFRSLQRALHPDYFSRRPQAERDLSQQHSALVNAAYQTLLRPLSRGLYLLELHGVKLAEGTDDNTDMEFLAEIMDINEKLADPENEASLQELESLIAAKQEKLITDVNQAFERDDLQEAKKLLAKMKYFANLEDKVKSKKIPS
ncbi:PREDICTED: iron-sulfur cluster co-chaperone protein HscB, mitochondrial, partial [Crocodylus porosus]|uniref:HscB mitochondrial iron-sulfur cluster cochaperone n=1 Tax=Crocodylus porosus TaxID=8502 RepID=A0A7M4EU45_CROPO